MSTFRNVVLALATLSALAGCQTIERRCDEPIKNQPYRQGGACCSDRVGNQCERGGDRERERGSFGDVTT